MALCNTCGRVAEWQDQLQFRVVKNWPPYDDNIQHHSSYSNLEASAKNGCPLCDLLCYDITLFPVREYRSRNNYSCSTWALIQDDIGALLRAWPASTEIRIFDKHLTGQNNYGVYYTVGDTGVTGVIPFVRKGSQTGEKCYKYLHRGLKEEERWLQARQWFQICETHLECGSPDSLYVPSRLIDVGRGQELGELRLVEFTERPWHGLPGTCPRYVALSYCWGDSMPVEGTTTVSNKSSRIQGFSIDDLPRTLQDAVTITRRLGMPYLWIDALCIIQDDPMDWQVESAVMSSIYSNAYFTIAAAASSHCNGAILVEHDSRLDLVVNIKLGNFTLQANAPTHHDLRDCSTLSTRAWTLQERELSPRILWFTKHMMSFECRKMWASEVDTSLQDHRVGISGIRDRSLHVFLRSLQNGIPTTPQATSLAIALRGYQKNWDALGEIYLAWRRIVEQYSSRNLTRPSDKLSALSGLAHVVQASMGSEYAAGLWVNDLLRGLLWRRILITQRQRSLRDDSEKRYLELVNSGKISGLAMDPVPRKLDEILEARGETEGQSSGYIAPSWSWASTNGPVDYRIAMASKRTDPVGFAKSLNARVLSVVVQPLGKDPMGQVQSGKIKLLGWTRPLQNWLAEPRNFWVPEMIYWDTTEEQVDVMILGLMRSDDYMEDVPAYNGLLIRQTNEKGEFRRMGLIKAVHAEWLGKGENIEMVIV